MEIAYSGDFCNINEIVDGTCNAFFVWSVSAAYELKCGNKDYTSHFNTIIIYPLNIVFLLLDSINVLINLFF